MKKLTFFIYFALVAALLGKVPFGTLYIEIEKTRYEGDPELIKNAEENSDMLRQYKSIQKIWVNVLENSYLMIEEPLKGNDQVTKNGKLKYKERHYTLDYDMKFAWDGTEIESERIYDNYTTDVPNYIFLKGKLAKKVKITTGDGEKRMAHIYAYRVLDPADEEQSNSYIKEIESSDMPQEEKEKEIQSALDVLDNKAVKYLEWIWVDESKNELQMFLRKHETAGNVKIEQNIIKLIVDKDFDYDVFEKTLSAFKVKVVKG
jgi:hypothetical protein